MTIKITNYNISQFIEYANNPQSLYNVIEARVSLTCALAMTKNLKRFIDISKENEVTLDKIIDKYATEEKSFVDTKGEQCVKDEYLPEYLAEVNNFWGQEREIDVDIISVSQLTTDPDHFAISCADLEALSFMIEDYAYV